MITKFKFFKDKSKIEYSCIFLVDESKDKLFNKFIKNTEYESWDLHSNHMTICLGSLPRHYRLYWLDEEIELSATHIGFNDKVIAIKVDGFDIIKKKSNDLINAQKFPHITLAVNISNGGEPKISNDIEHWVEIENIKLKGIIKEKPIKI